MSDRSPITTHILDTAAGRPAAGVAVTLCRVDEQGAAVEVASGRTDADGRITDLLPAGTVKPGGYRLRFDTGSYLGSEKSPAFFPSVSIDFVVTAENEHYHVPLLLSPFGYSTYRGS